MVDFSFMDDKSKMDTSLVNARDIKEDYKGKWGVEQ